MSDGGESERGKHSKERPVELLVAAHCLLASKNQLNTWTSYVDDEGADLVLKRWQRDAMLAIQVKACFVGSRGVERTEFTCIPSGLFRAAILTTAASR
jgi:hypothetical protein